ncbi:MAG: hypothetical protein ACI9LX_001385 [Paraglaciecola sp.]|jgi:hypothetical protein
MQHFISSHVSLIVYQFLAKLHESNTEPYSWINFRFSMKTVIILNESQEEFPPSILYVSHLLQSLLLNPKALFIAVFSAVQNFCFIKRKWTSLN